MIKIIIIQLLDEKEDTRQDVHARIAGTVPYI